jgi:hypothetical protein
MLQLATLVVCAVSDSLMAHVAAAGRVAGRAMGGQVQMVHMLLICIKAAHAGRGCTAMLYRSMVHFIA